MGSTLDSRDGWRRRAHQLGELLLGEVVLRPELNEETGNRLRSGEPSPDLPELRIRLLVAADVIGNTGSNRAHTTSRHDQHVTTFGNTTQGPKHILAAERRRQQPAEMGPHDLHEDRGLTGADSG